ncbi:MAG: hypothetical protein ACRDRK_00770 [Pseudonocardia sp.]
MTATLDHATTPTTGTTAATTVPNARGEAVFLTAEHYTLTARQLVYALACHLARYGDTLSVKVVDPLTAIDAVMRFDVAGHHHRLTDWTIGRTPTDAATIRARAEHIARDYFGHDFPVIPW